MDQLPRRLGLLDATLIVVGIVIGSGIFLLPNLIARNLPSAAAILGVWVVAGILSYFGALGYAELGAMMPSTGGQYVYLREAYGEWCAFLCGWVFTLAAVPGGIAFLAVGFSIYLGQFLPLTAGMRTAVSLALVLGLSVINAVGVREGVWVQRLFTWAKMLGLALVIGAAIFGPGHGGGDGAALGSLNYGGFGIAMAACLMAYIGWSYVSFVAGEVKDPGTNLPRALAWGMAS
jgi:APA family basic amino acid/polyamine antiporter